MSEENPYEAPAANIAQEPNLGSFELTDPKAVSIGRGWGWIVEGFGHFKKNPGSWILMLFVALIVLIIIALIPIIGQLAIMFTYYVWLAGIILGCRAQARGEDFRVAHLFAGFSNHVGKLILLSLIMTVFGIAVSLIVMGPVYMELITSGFQPDPETIEKISERMADPTGFWLPWLISMLFTVPLAMAIWFAPALIVLNEVPLLSALKLSFIGCLKNILPFLLYGILAMILYILSALPLLLGLLVFVPTMFASIYTSYTDIFIES